MKHALDRLVRATLSPAAGILYAEDFDEEPAPPEPAPDPDPVYTGADVEEARLQGTDAGRAEATASAELAELQSRSAALAGIVSGLNELAQGVATELERSTAELSRTVLSLLHAALPSLMESTAGREVSGLLSRVLPGLHAERTVTVRISPHLADRVGADLDALDEEHRNRIVLVPTDALLPGDLRVSWHDGSLLRDTGAIHRATRAILATAGQLEVARDERH